MQSSSWFPLISGILAGWCGNSLFASPPDSLVSEASVGISEEALPGGEASPQDLFASGDFSQWVRVNGRPVSIRWTITDGTVHRAGFRPGDIVTTRHYRDFDLSFEWKISPGGNSGIKYRTRGSLGLEYQILDDAKHRDASTPSHRAAALYGLVAAPDNKPLKPVGQWNQGRIVAKGDRIEHWLNGEKVVDVNLSDEAWMNAFENSKFNQHEGFGHWVGPILLQDHGDEVWFRNLTILEL